MMNSDAKSLGNIDSIVPNGHGLSKENNALQTPQVYGAFFCSMFFLWLYMVEGVYKLCPKTGCLEKGVYKGMRFRVA